MLDLALSALLGLAAAVLYTVALAWTRRRRTQERLFGPDAEAPAAAATAEGRLARWLALAGFRRSDAGLIFLAASAASLGAGGLLAWGIRRSALVAEMAHWANGIPGGVGDLALPILYGMPWIVFAMASLVPLVIVRMARQRRVQAVENELPIVLEMLATLSEAGLGFDAAIVKLIEVHPESTPLLDELRLYQTEILGGVSRIRALRNVRTRLDVGPVTVFVSALVQAEQVGAALTDVLRRQAEDARGRNRQRALIRAEGLPTKLVFPLVICYLPGIFVTTLGPSLVQFAKLADSFARGRGAGR
ncbi:MAG TPA: type II secretion system F family protein [Planctomycetota bacterium]|nr:type II secretion system F family protein [Planctomycetota bacterium]